MENSHDNYLNFIVNSKNPFRILCPFFYCKLLEYDTIRVLCKVLSSKGMGVALIEERE